MKFKAYAKMQSCPTVELDTIVEPIEFETSARGAFDAQLGPFSAEVGEIPVRMTIPFLRGRRKPTLIVTLGGFHLKLAQFRLNVEGASLDFNGRLGLKGLRGKLKGQIGCETDLETEGQILGRLGLSHIDFCDDEQIKKNPIDET